MCDCISWYVVFFDVGWILEILGICEVYSRIVEEESGGVSFGRFILKVLMENFIYFVYVLYFVYIKWSCISFFII